MRFKKFLLIPALVFIYVFFIVDMLVNYSPTSVAETTTTTPSGGGQPIGVSESVSVYVTRPYFFGLIRLPVYTNYIGYIGGYHEMFFYSMGALTVIFIVLEFFVDIVWGRDVGKSRIERVETRMETTKWRGTKMRGGLRIKDLAKAIGIGAVFGFVLYLLTTDGGVSVGLGLLMMYLEYKLK